MAFLLKMTANASGSLYNQPIQTIEADTLEAALSQLFDAKVTRCQAIDLNEVNAIADGKVVGSAYICTQNPKRYTADPQVTLENRLTARLSVLGDRLSEIKAWFTAHGAIVDIRSCVHGEKFGLFADAADLWVNSPPVNGHSLILRIGHDWYPVSNGEDVLKLIQK